MLKLYGVMTSTYVSKVVLALRYKQIPFELVATGLDALSTAEFRELNPMRKVPALLDGDFAVAESHVICEYLEARFPARPLLPGEPPAAARVRALAVTAERYVHIPQMDIVRQLMSPQPDQARMEDARILMNRGLEAVEAYLDERGPYARGELFTLADCALVAPMWAQDELGATTGLDEICRPPPRLVAYWQRLRDEDPVRETLDEMSAALHAHLARREQAAAAQ